MKYLIATDIHGSAFWAQKIADKFRQIGADALILLGDVYNHGPRNPFPADYAPLKVADCFNAIADRIVAVKGNCDSQVDQMISDFPFIEQHLLLIDNRRIFFTHGHVYNKDNLPSASRKGDVLFYGHFHTSQATDVNGVTCINVGSPSLPKDGRSAYCILTDGSATVYDFDDVEILSRKIS